MVLQSVPRRSVAKQAAVARRLIAVSGVASHVIDTTIEYQSDNPVIRCRNHEAFVLGRAVVMNGEAFYMVASKFANRYYVVVHRSGTWVCSAKDERVAAECIAKVVARNTRKTELLIGDAYERLA